MIREKQIGKDMQKRVGGYILGTNPKVVCRHCERP
jgi:hypothetical protein